jgi:hypothetical protein
MRRMMERRDHRAGDEADALRSRRDRGKEYARVRRVAAVVVERMLDRLDAREAELVGARREAQALIVIIGGGRILGAERGKEINSESHGVRSPVAMLS